MLQIFRDKSQSTFIQAIVLVIALVFVFWGVGANMMDNPEAAIVVNDEEISFQQYQNEYEQLLSQYRQQFGGAVPETFLESLGVGSQVKNQLIQQVLLRQGADSMGIFVSTPEVQQNIQEMVQFQENGSFNIEKYKAILASNRFTPHKYESLQRVDMLANRGIQAIGNFATTVTEAEIADMYKQAKETVSLSYVGIDPTDFSKAVVVEDDALQLWFDKNKERYKTAPKVQLKYLSFPYADDNSPTDLDERKIRSLVFQKANAAYEGIIAAGSLQEFAKLQPDISILETDFFSRKSVPENIDPAPTVQDTAFSLKSGELSSLIESPSGYSILYAQAIQQPEIPLLESVRDKVVEDYKKDQAIILAQEKSVEILTALKSGSVLSDTTLTPDMTVKDVSLSRSSTEADIGDFPPSLLGTVFSLNAENPVPSEPASVNGKFYLYQFTKRALPDVSAMTEEEKEQYTTQLIAAKKERILVAWIRHQEKKADIFTNRNL